MDEDPNSRKNVRQVSIDAFFSPKKGLASTDLDPLKERVCNEEDDNITILEITKASKGEKDLEPPLDNQESAVDTSTPLSVTVLDVKEKDLNSFQSDIIEKHLLEAAQATESMRITPDTNVNSTGVLMEDYTKSNKKRSKRDKIETSSVRQPQRGQMSTRREFDEINEELITKVKKNRKKEHETQDDVLSTTTATSLTLVEDTNDAGKCDKVEVEDAPAILDAVTKTRVEMYKQKLADLLSLCKSLQGCSNFSSGEEFSMLQEVYGLGKDHNLKSNLDVNETAEQQQRKISLQFDSVRLALQDRVEAFDETKIVECPTSLRSFLGHYVQGKSLTLTALMEQLLSHFNVKIDQSEILSTLSLWLEMEFKILAQRHCYGARPQRPNIFEDTSDRALWLWEVGNIEQVFSSEAQKLIRRMRKHRKRLGQQLRTLARILHLLHQQPIDEVKVSLEEAKVARFSHIIESEIRRGKYRERKDNEKQAKRDHKERSEGDKFEQKKFEKRRREEALEQERMLANKRKKSMVSYFRSIDSTGNEQTGPGLDSSTLEGGVCAVPKILTATCPSGVQSYGQGRYPDNKFRNGNMSSFDEAVHWVATNKTSAKHMREGTGELACGASENFTKSNRARKLSMSNWTCKRQRHEKLGIMKLLQFAENHRPAFYGTFNKTSHLLRNGRRPFARAGNVDYSVDSDDEWEEEEPGESLSDESEHESEDEDNCLDYNDSWLAHDNEIEYREDGQCSSDTELDDNMQKISGQTCHQSSKRSKRVLKKLLIQIEGPFFCQHSHDTNKDVIANGSCEYSLVSQLGQRLCSPNFESPQLRKAREFESSAGTPSQINQKAK
ncbi:unnamed protein product [Albugo candida]|uniref:Chromatin assembly factor 1 subunit A dimerization domain-containing protein n=1 Tax=Albugo candida TaxID=65357 RepID=A0A024FU39_9STRA|nr:unnamed protein product [Albugo candida]|eukprot:CCI10640.1 unnamed protein product [Albugo candida]